MSMPLAFPACNASRTILIAESRIADSDTEGCDLCHVFLKYSSAPSPSVLWTFDRFVTSAGASGHFAGAIVESQFCQARVQRAEDAMSGDRRNPLEVLRYELNFLEQGGYDRNLATGKGRSPFQDNLTCLNFGDPLRPHACHECVLYDFVPDAAKSEDVPCHYIPLDPAGHTIHDYLRDGNLVDLERSLKTWLRAAINRSSDAVSQSD
jgi:hypothetical protein